LPELKPSTAPKFSISVVKPQVRPITPLDAERFLTHYLQSLNDKIDSILAAYSRDATFAVQLQCLHKDYQLCIRTNPLWHGFAFRNLQASPRILQSSPSLASLTKYLEGHPRLPSNPGDMDMEVDIVLLSDELLLLIANQILPKHSEGPETMGISISHTFILDRHPAFDGPWPLQVRTHQMTIRHMEAMCTTR